MGFCASFVALLKTYMFHCSLFVSTGGVSTCRVSVKAGALLGIVLYSLLFNIFVSAMQNIVSDCKTFKFADDTVIFFLPYYFC